MTVPKYVEGDWFAVPLKDGGFGVGLVARKNAGGVLLGYFFGPKRTTLPELKDLTALSAEDAVLISKFGHLGLRQGKWPILGRLEGWTSTLWPMPAFIRYEELTGRSFRVTYDPQDPNRVLQEEQIPPGRAEQGPRDGLLGAGLVEKVLARLLA